MTEKSKNYTMIDVAKEAGVSLKTVSRVLNKENYVREETRTKVLEASEKLNYKLNQTARTLRSGNAQIVSLLVDNPSRSYLESVHFGALERCHDLSMQLILEECPNGLSDVREILQKLAPVGFILTPPLCDNAELLELLDSHGCAYVLIAPNEPDSNKLSVNMDDMAASMEMTEYLITLNHQRIGYIKGHPDHGASEKRYQGYCKALEKHGIDLDPSLVRQGYFDYESGLEGAEALLDIQNPPTAIFASNDDMAAAVLSAAYRRNISVPQNLSVAGYDDTPIAAIISPQLTTIKQPITELAAAAVSLLSENISHTMTPKTGKKRIFLDHDLIERESVALPN